MPRRNEAQTMPQDPQDRLGLGLGGQSCLGGAITQGRGDCTAAGEHETHTPCSPPRLQSDREKGISRMEERDSHAAIFHERRAPSIDSSSAPRCLSPRLLLHPRAGAGHSTLVPLLQAVPAPRHPRAVPKDAPPSKARLDRARSRLG